MKSLNSNDQQFHQYQQNHQSPFTEHKKDHDVWCWKSGYWLGTGI